MVDITQRLALTPAEAAEAIDVSLPTLYQLIKRERDPLPSFRIGRKILIPVLSMQQWIEAQECAVESA
jgi:excisionase family DNA binding protein